MNHYKMLMEAITTATIAHSGTYDRAGKPYILHPLHLMSKFPDDPELAAIAVLHDVIEDTYVTVDMLELAGYSVRVIEAVIALTHEASESYHQYITRICANVDATKVKIEDLKHNSDITRLKGVSSKDLMRMEKYHRAYMKLKKAKEATE